MDDDGRGGPPTTDPCSSVKRGGRLTVDLSGSALAGLRRVQRAVGEHPCGRRLRASSDDRPVDDANDGLLRPLDIVCPWGASSTLGPPAAVSVRHNTCQRLADVLVRAFSDLWPEQCGREQHGDVRRHEPEQQLARFRPPVGAERRPRRRHGGARDGPGLDGVDTYMANVGLMPVEVAEGNYSVRVLRTELIEGSEGTASTMEGEDPSRVPDPRSAPRS